MKCVFFDSVRTNLRINASIIIRIIIIINDNTINSDDIFVGIIFSLFITKMCTKEWAHNENWKWNFQPTGMRKKTCFSSHSLYPVSAWVYSCPQFAFGWLSHKIGCGVRLLTNNVHIYKHNNNNDIGCTRHMLLLLELSHAVGAKIMHMHHAHIFASASQIIMIIMLMNVCNSAFDTEH